VDEIEDYWNARYLSTGEAVWRILGYNLTKKKPAVTPVSVHLPTNESNRQYHRRRGEPSSMSSLNRYFSRPHGTFTYDGVVRHFSQLTYIEYFSLFRFQKFNPNHVMLANHFTEQRNEYGDPPMQVILRTSGRKHLARIHDIPPSRGELFYLRTLLQHKPALSFDDARTVDDTLYDTYQEAATALGLFATEKEAEYALLEGIQTLKTPRQLRVLFVHLLVNDCIPTPMLIWHNLAHNLATDHILHHQNIARLGIDHALRNIGTYLEEYGKKLSDYGLPEPTSYARETEHELSRWNSDPDTLTAQADNAAVHLNPEQREIYDDVLHAVNNGLGLQIFVDGKAGMGKTFIVNAICDKVRSLGRIVLPTAIAAFAAQHYAGGRTTHSAFKVYKFFGGPQLSL